MSNDLFCRNATCPCLDYPGCKTSAVEDRPAAKLCDCNQGRLPCTCKTQTADRLAYLDKLLPQVAEITHYLSQNSLGTLGEDCLPRALELIKKGRTQEAELYAAQDQVAGLQELMRAQRPQPQPMDTAPTDGTRVLIHTEVHHYTRSHRVPFSAWRKVGTQWLEARFKDGKWVEWCGNDKTNSTGTLHPIEWAPLPGSAQ